MSNLRCNASVEGTSRRSVFGSLLIVPKLRYADRSGASIVVVRIEVLLTQDRQTDDSFSRR
jgi:hypothetical protein